MPSQAFVHCHVSFHCDDISDEPWLREMVAQHGFHITDLSYRLNREANLFEYKFAMWSSRREASRTLAGALLALPAVVNFRIAPSRD
jgi:putative Mg2+ transporter-C (MgtC) family protein